MAYFDNAATTFPKPDSVYMFMDQYYRANGASAGRGIYAQAMSVGQLVSDTRSRLQKLLNCPAKQIVFTQQDGIFLKQLKCEILTDRLPVQQILLLEDI